MKKTYRRKKTTKKAYRKRKTFKRRGPRSDGAISLKCHTETPVQFKTASGHANVTINWGGNGTAAGVGATLTLPGINEFTHFSADYNEYKITGVKIDFFPI